MSGVPRKQLYQLVRLQAVGSGIKKEVINRYGIGKHARDAADKLNNDVDAPYGIVYVVVPPSEPKCEWFALCNNPASGLQPHPVLGEVLICTRCADKVTRLGGGS